MRQVRDELDQVGDDKIGFNNSAARIIFSQAQRAGIAGKQGGEKSRFFGRMDVVSHVVAHVQRGRWRDLHLAKFFDGQLV